MKFGEVPVAEAEGAILAHSLKLGTTALKKGAGAVARRCRADRCVRPADGSSSPGSNPAMSARTRPPRGSLRPRPGRKLQRRPRSPAAPISSPRRAGFWCSIRERLDRLNLVDEAMTLGTLPPFAVVEPKQMVATVKIIPFAAPETAVARLRRGRGRGRPAAAGRALSCRARSGLCRHGSPG